MLRVGLTGSIATGKSTVLARFAEMGVPAYSADEAVHALYAGEAAPQIETLFPGVVVDGAVDRRRLSAALAQDPGRIGELEAVIHPLVFEKALGFLDAAEEAGAELAVLEIPLLYETGLRYPIDTVVVTWCADPLQRDRALARPGMTGEKLDLMLARQWSQAEKKARADYVIDTSGELDDTRREVDFVIAALRAEARALDASSEGGDEGDRT